MSRGITSFRLRALRVVNSRPGIKPREFAKAMWPNSRYWRRSTAACMGGVQKRKGGGMWLAGGSQLAILRKSRLVRPREKGGFELTVRGLKTLANNRWVRAS